MTDYSIWVLEYSYVKNYHLSGIIYGAHNQGYKKLPYCYVLIKGKGQAAMVDVGYNHKDYGKTMADNFGVENWRSPKDVLAECGVAPDQISSVFITHAHFDHMGGTDDFPKATFYIQERELSKWVWAMSLDRKFRWLMLATDPATSCAPSILRARAGSCASTATGKMCCRASTSTRRRIPIPGDPCTSPCATTERMPQDAWVLAGDSCIH